MPMLYFRLFALLAALTFAKPAAAQDCTDPDGDIGIILYNEAYGVFQGCTAHGWAAFHRMLQPLGCPSSGLVGHWKLNESGNVSTTADSAGTNDGTLTNFPADPSANWVTGKLGNALAFDGTDDYVNLGTMGSFGSQIGLMSVSAWVNTTASSSSEIIGVANPNGRNQVQLIINGNEDLTDHQGWVAAYLNEDDPTFSDDLGGSVQADTGIADGNWHHIVWVLDGPGGIINIYVDGIEQTVTLNASYSGTPETFVNFTENVPIGALNDQGGIFSEYTDGLIDDVRIYDRVLSQADIDALYNGGAGCQ